MKLILLGAPGSGKGTMAQKLTAALDIPQISTGDIFRKNLKEETPLGLQVKNIMASGALVPDEITIEIVKNRLAEDDCQKGYILDGFPRTVEQAKALSTFAKIDVAINLDVPDDVLVKRLSGRRVCPLCGAPYHVDRLNGETVCRADGTPLIQRDDDKAETVLNRLAVYHQKTAPLIDHYREAGLLKNIGGGLSLEEISEEIFRTLEAIQ